MNVWHSIQIYEGESYISSHFTKKGALVCQTEDILSYLDERAEDDREQWLSTMKDWGLENNDFVLREDILNWREWTVDEIWKLRDILIELTWDNGSVDWFFLGNELQP